MHGAVNAGHIVCVSSPPLLLLGKMYYPSEECITQTIYVSVFRIKCLCGISRRITHLHDLTTERIGLNNRSTTDK